MATKERLDPAKIVDTALAIADEEGPAAISLRKLAAQHDVTPMALYRHFKDKDDLLAALGARLLAEVVLPEPSDAPWDVQLRELLTAVVTALRAHPRLADLTRTQFLVAEAGLALSERTLDLLVQGGFSVDDAAEVGRQTVSALVALVVGDPIAREVSDPEARAASVRRKQASLNALSPERYPRITSAARTLIWPKSQDRYYEIGIELTLAGIRGIRP
ncbi:TetR/AcrR family transcriptional regulator [Kribbella sp. NPDC048915]|uniref:TetR/AcrR family transcriptional regulator n=1 Tax=Kribbella sp. NPDC048915 TaxID=3155148 RepID=UPI0033F366B0